MPTSPREVRKRIESVAGLEVVSLRIGGKHWRTNVRTPNGKTHLFIMSVTESDWRVPRKQRAQLRRLARENAATDAAQCSGVGRPH